MIVLLDNYDSFTYNIVQYLGELGAEVRVFRSDKITVAGIEELAPAALVVSPGPGRPEDAGVSCDAIRHFAGKIPILGVCLGHQCIGEVFGADIVQAKELVHGLTDRIFHDGETMYGGMANPFQATRYHSLTVDEESIKPPLRVSAFSSTDGVMGLRCDDMAVEGVQFHPESIATDSGKKLLAGFLECYLPDEVKEMNRKELA